MFLVADFLIMLNWFLKFTNISKLWNSTSPRLAILYQLWAVANDRRAHTRRFLYPISLPSVCLLPSYILLAIELWVHIKMLWNLNFERSYLIMMSTSICELNNTSAKKGILFSGGHYFSALLSACNKMLVYHDHIAFYVRIIIHFIWSHL